MTAPTSTVDIAGKPVSKPIVIGGVAVAGLLVVYLVYKHHKASAAAAATPAVDTTTGTLTAGDTGFSNPVPGAVGSSTVDTSGGTVPTTNDQWVQKVLGDFANQGSIYDPLYASQTLGAYLAGVPLTQDQAVLVRTAWGLEGKPPQGDIPIVLTTTGSTTGTTPPPVPTGPPTTPPPAPSPTPTPAPAPTPARLRRYVVTVPFQEPNPDWRSTLSGIEGHTGVSVGNLAAWNGISNPNLIGSHVRIYIDPPTPPGGGSWSGAVQIG